MPPGSYTTTGSSWLKSFTKGVSSQKRELRDFAWHRKQWQRREVSPVPEAAVPSKVTCIEGGPDHRYLFQGLVQQHPEARLW